jgi:hypothetical protein
MKLTTEQKQELIINYRRLNDQERRFIRELMASPARAIVPKLFGEDIAELLRLIPTQNMKAGGVVQAAQKLASQGRDGDTMLVHMAPSEVRGLQSMMERQGSSLSINPNTGLVEAKKAKEYLRDFAPILPFVIPGAGALLGGLGGQAVASGLIAGIAAPGKGINFNAGIKAGLMAYGLGSAYNKFNDIPSGTAIGPGNQAVGGTNMPSVSSGPSSVSSAYGGVGVGNDMSAYASGFSGDPSLPVATLPSASSLAPPPAVPPANTTATSPVANKGKITKFEDITGLSPTTALIGGNMALGAYQANKEMELAKDQIAAVEAEKERKRREAQLAFENSLGRVDQPITAAGGGLVAFARGGTTGPTHEPRMVKGDGDGMSDSVPATIEGVQEARLANDEFVIPADVVADIGNGSSSAGAKKLYTMMDRVRKARHGTTEQPPEINARKYMPA